MRSSDVANTGFLIFELAVVRYAVSLTLMKITWVTVLLNTALNMNMGLGLSMFTYMNRLFSQNCIKV